MLSGRAKWHKAFNIKFYRSNICRYRLEDALKVMSEITGFERNLESFIFSRSLNYTLTHTAVYCQLHYTLILYYSWHSSGASARQLQ